MYVKSAEETRTTPPHASLQLAGLEKRPYLGGFAIVMVHDLHQPTPEIRALATRVCEGLHDHARRNPPAASALTPAHHAPTWPACAWLAK